MTEHQPVAIVTGAGSGIGRATALRLAQDGAAVVAVDVNDAGLKETVALTGAQASIGTLVLDVSADDAPGRAVAEAVARFGRLDWLVNNAGIGGSAPVGETSDESFDRYVSVNLRSVFRFSRAALPQLEASQGAIVNVSSVFGMLGFAGMSSYSVTKAGISGLTRQMAADYGPRGVRVNAVAPGAIETALTRARWKADPGIKTLMVGSTPFPRCGQPEDVAGAIRFLLSLDAAYVNGHVLVVDGGWSATKWRAAE